jgi:pyruvate dehydrogenase (quinone)
MNGKRRLLGSFNHGTMANAMPQSIGVQSAEPSRQVITLSGDGGISMLLGDLLTLRQLDLHVKVIVFNNGALGFVEQEMKAAGVETYATEFKPQNFAAIASGAGIRSWRVETPEQVIPRPTGSVRLFWTRCDRRRRRTPGTFPSAHNHPGPSCGFNLYMLKAMLHGDGHEVLDMAKTNLWR